MVRRLGARGDPAPDGAGKAERSEAFTPEAGAGSGSPHGRPRRRWSVEQKQATVEAWLASGKSAPTFAAEQGLGLWQLYQWRRKLGFLVEHRSARPPAPDRTALIPTYTPEEKRAAVEEFES